LKTAPAVQLTLNPANGVTTTLHENDLRALSRIDLETQVHGIKQTFRGNTDPLQIPRNPQKVLGMGDNAFPDILWECI
jgi:hypothetical protein